MFDSVKRMLSFIKWLVINQKIGLKSRSPMKSRTDWLTSCYYELWTGSICVPSYVQLVFKIEYYYCCPKIVKFFFFVCLFVHNFFYFVLICPWPMADVDPQYPDQKYFQLVKKVLNCWLIIHYQRSNIPTLDRNVTEWKRKTNVCGDMKEKRSHKDIFPNIYELDSETKKVNVATSNCVL